MFLKIEDIYQKVRKNIKILPNSPATKIKLNKMMEKRRNNEIKKLIKDEDIRKSFEFYIANHKQIEDNQGVYKILFLLQCIKETEDLEGNIIELGSWKAGNSILMAKFLQQINSKKKIFACDTFEGIPNDDEFVSNKKGKNLFKDVQINNVLKKIKEFGVEKEIQIVKGDFSNSLKQFENQKFSLVFLDCNIYSSAKIAINFAYPRLSLDGICLSHCYGIKKDEESFWGEGVAVKEYLSSKPEKMIIDSIPFFQKGYENAKLNNIQPKDKFNNYSEL